MGEAREAVSSNNSNKVLIDSIVDKAISQAPFFEKIVQECRADLYIKGHLNIPKKNFAFRYVPKMFKLQKGVNEYMIESFSEMHFTRSEEHTSELQSHS